MGAIAGAALVKSLAAAGDINGIDVAPASASMTLTARASASAASGECKSVASDATVGGGTVYGGVVSIPEYIHTCAQRHRTSAHSP